MMSCSVPAAAQIRFLPEYISIGQGEITSSQDPTLYTYKFFDNLSKKLVAVDRLDGEVHFLNKDQIKTSHPDYIDLTVFGDEIFPKKFRVGSPTAKILIYKSTSENFDGTGETLLFGNTFDPDGYEGNITIEAGIHNVSSDSIRILPYTEIKPDAEINFVINN